MAEDVEGATLATGDIADTVVGVVVGLVTDIGVTEAPEDMVAVDSALALEDAGAPTNRLSG